MAGLKEIKNRLESVQSTGQLTAAMKMVSASKLRKAQKKMIALRSFAYQMTELYKVINSGLEENAEAMLILKGRPIQRKVLIIVITSNKGLCGSFNVNVCKAAEEYIAEKYAKLKAEGSLEILCLGNKGAEYFKRKQYKISSIAESLNLEALSYAEIAKMVNGLTDSFMKEVYDGVDVVCYQPLNAATQLLRIRSLLPVGKLLDLASEKALEAKGSKAAVLDAISAQKLALSFRDNTDLLPDKNTVLVKVLPMLVSLSLYYMICEAFVAEHGARMTAMSKASDNADQLVKNLNLNYNKMRQAAITNELLEIVSGANALNG